LDAHGLQQGNDKECDSRSNQSPAQALEPGQPPLAASFVRIRPRAGVVGPGQRQTGNN
jgi:hypothetical protein